MPVFNGEKYIKEAIDSVLQQSFEDFEFIIIDDGSTDASIDIVRSYSDRRIRLLENKHDFIGSLNLGLQTAVGKYIARMDADDVMHIDRLRIQHRIMEDEPSFTVCGSWMTFFGEKVYHSLSNQLFGVIDYPLVRLLSNCFVNHPTVIVRKSFLEEHHLQYERYMFAEDYKLWAEVAKADGVFYIESQPLLNYRISVNQVSNTKRNEQIASSIRVKEEILEHLINIYEERLLLYDLHNSLNSLKDKGLVTLEEIFVFFHTFFVRNIKDL